MWHEEKRQGKDKTKVKTRTRQGQDKGKTRTRPGRGQRKDTDRTETETKTETKKETKAKTKTNTKTGQDRETKTNLKTKTMTDKDKDKDKNKNKTKIKTRLSKGRKYTEQIRNDKGLLHTTVCSPRSSPPLPSPPSLKDQPPRPRSNNKTKPSSGALSQYAGSSRFSSSSSRLTCGAFTTGGCLSIVWGHYHRDCGFD